MQRFRTFSERTGERDEEADTTAGNARRRTGILSRALPARNPMAGMPGLALRFAVVGGGGVVVNTLVLYALYHWAGLPLLAASSIAVELAVVHNYLLNDRWTFAAGDPSLRRFIKFNITVLGGLGVNVLIVWTLVRTGMHLLLANCLGIAAAFAVNFASSTGWVWGRRSR
ncbi:MULTISPECIES: GtrA family protein [Streptomyces]|uniref:GtrA family protein n=1 Tax=Streptomyces malaysiensis TaxID=92644 RepID=A0ABX6W845_STRMQ|nr:MULTISPECIES: GtrA family protein [Streptomyces]MYU12085.1 GtrA family protein [Streptomyces sp. SID8361]AUA12871.1 GtrA-like protein [Streptomyces sp. M56]MCC4319294.1 GtrA family protein [Streptomyces malaysiensis]MCD9590278.1 GtrA family protein [Streptomyces sp. 8ZJF_21]MCQ6245163.1 GtrA family protein [Streptomyces malaysiensis]